MNFLIRVFIIFLFTYFFGFDNHWWLIVIYPIIVGLIFIDNLLSHFISGFLGIFLAWLVLMFQLDAETYSIISQKIANILFLNNNIILLTISSSIGGILGGIGSIFGQSIRKIFLKNLNQDPYID
tara:strand:+ start:1891 stop:2265 length:375 start_codon:yes stop_codon:yes gene_type:complete